MNGIYLTVSTFNALQANTQAEILSVAGFTGGAVNHSVAAAETTDEDGPSALSPLMVRKLTEKLGDKTLSVLRTIAQNESATFRLKDIIAATDGAETYTDLRGVWSALTRRTRKILNDPDAILIWWDDNGTYDAKGDYIDHVMSVAPSTHQSLRSYFKI